MKAKTLKAPFPYFGGKAKVAGIVWPRLGNVDNYVEAFCGSAAMLLARPHAPTVETINDADCYVANFWRATSTCPEEVARWADGPVNEADLHSRHRWLVLSANAAEFRKRMRAEPGYFDARIAGWWVWGLCQWIGSGWCDASQLERHAGARPHITHASGNGIHAKGTLWQQIVHLGDNGMGIYGVGPGAGGLQQRRPHLGGRDASDAGMGIHRPQPHAGTCEQRLAWLVDWMQRLRDRLRTVRVCCGDWSRVCSSPSTTIRLGTTGVFLDPPYGDEANRTDNIYATDSGTVAAEVRAWCLEYGTHPQMRIALCGYADEGHEVLEQDGWTVEHWKTSGGYANVGTGNGKDNAKRERIWFSPACLRSGGLFDGLD